MPLDVTRASKPEHFQQIADLHASGISEGFLSTLGLPFLSQLYRGISTARNSGVLVAHDEQEVLGFISYAHDVRSCYKDVLKRRWPRLGWTLLPNLLRSGVYRKVFETLGYPRHQKSSAGRPREQKSGAPRPELLSMAVSSKARELENSWWRLWKKNSGGTVFRGISWSPTPTTPGARVFIPAEASARRGASPVMASP